MINHCELLFEQISVMNASVGLVIVEGEKNVSVSWTMDYPDILLADELQLNDMNKKCNNFGRIASTGINYNVDFLVLLHQ